jgi:hypothetical protein
MSVDQKFVVSGASGSLGGKITELLLAKVPAGNRISHRHQWRMQPNHHHLNRQPRMAPMCQFIAPLVLLVWIDRLRCLDNFQIDQHRKHVRD